MDTLKHRPDNLKKMYELANEPKYSYFPKYDDHMMEYNENLLNVLKDFIQSLN